MAPGEDTRPLILVVDDDATTRLMIRETLGQAGFRTEEARDGEEGLELFAEHKPDLVLLDLMMPRRTGFEVCGAIRQEIGDTRTPIVTLTSLDDLESIQRTYELGATDFITKPIPWMILQHRVRHILRASQMMAQLESSRARLANAQRIASLGSWEWRADRDEIELSDEGRRILAIPGDLRRIGVDTILSVTHAEDRERVQEWLDASLEQGRENTIEHRVKQPDGSERTVRQRVVVAADPGGAVQQASFVVYDITEWRRAEEEVAYQLYFDSLTGLQNRNSLLCRINASIVRVKRARTRLAVLVLGLDRFKHINEAYGRRIGDQALKIFVDRLREVLRRADLECIDEDGPALARIGGDEFAVLVEPLENTRIAAKLANRLHEAFSRPLPCEQQELPLTASIGIAVYPEDATSDETLVRAAEIAMNHAKSIGRNEIQFCTPSMNTEMAERFALETRLHGAIARDELQVFYQPQADVQSGRITGMEALLRWDHPDLGIVCPSSFIPVAEETGLIQSIGEWVLHSACSQAKRWQDRGFPDLRIAVNFSVEQIRKPATVEMVRRILESSALDPRLLEIEITESVLLGDSEAQTANLHRLKELGVRLSIDDFGTGYSSLSYLQRLPVDALKIDQSFVRDLLVSADAVEITTAILKMARALGLEVIAEGVETAEHLEFLVRNHCDQYQGFLCSPPLPGHLADVLLEQENAPAGTGEPSPTP